VRELQRHESQYYDRMIDPEKISGWYVDDLTSNAGSLTGVSVWFGLTGELQVTRQY
jgi:hypothetical protein